MARRLARHVLERRAEMMATAMQHRIDVQSRAITPPGAKPPFTRKYTAVEALQWWLQHRYDNIGAGVLAGMQPQQIAALDAWLAQASNHPAAQGLTGVHAPQGGDQILTRAMGAERRIEGPPVGSEVA